MSSATELTGSALVSLQKAGWATRVPAMASSAWWSPRSISGAWTTKAACSAVRCRVPGCAGRSLKMLSSRWQSHPQVRLPSPCSCSCSLFLLPVSAPCSCSPPPGADILAQGSPAAALGSGCLTRFASSGTFKGVFSKERELLHWMSIHSVNGVQFEFLFSLLIAMVTPDHIFVS